MSVPLDSDLEDQLSVSSEEFTPPPQDPWLYTSLDELTPPPPSPRPRVWVELARLSLAEREKYQEISEEAFPSFTKPRPEPPLQVIGQYNDNGTLYYFAKHADGLAYKEPAEGFEAKYPALVSEFKNLQDANKLPKFDPTASYIHPDSRIRFLIVINRRRPPVELGTSSGMTLSSLPPSESPSEEEWAGDDAEGETSSRRSTRSVKKTRELPFSPRRVRTNKKPIIVDSMDDEDHEMAESSDSSRRPRQSGRTRRQTKKVIEIDDDEDGEEDDRSYAPSKSKKNKRSREQKAVRPVYGVIRKVGDLDDESDDEVLTLRAHRDLCDSCKLPMTQPLLDKLRKKPKKAKRKRTNDSDDEFEEDEEERLLRLGGWVRCIRCPVVAHWGCLAATQRDEILRIANAKELDAWQMRQNQEMDTDSNPPPFARPPKRSAIATDEVTEFICGSCSKDGVCMGCLEPIQSVSPTTPDPSVDVSSRNEADKANDATLPEQLLFRCVTCKRPAHYAHLPFDTEEVFDDETHLLSTAKHYQQTNEWQCADCASFIYPLEKILAWRPYPPNAKEPSRSQGEPINHKAPLPREYLVKWENRGYRRSQWVPHMWLLARSPAKLKNFLNGGTKVKLLEVPEPDSPPRIEKPSSQAAEAALKEDTPMEVDHAEPSLKVVSWSDPLPDAERRIPSAWRTVDRVLDVLLLKPPKSKKKPRVILKLSKNHRRVDSDEEEEDPAMTTERNAAYDRGEQPSEAITETIDEWEKRNKRDLTTRDIDLVIWCFIKWDDLGYEEATWDAPPRHGEPGWAAFENAFERFLNGRLIPKPSGPTVKEQARKRNDYMRKYRLQEGQQPDLGQRKDLKLMDFQVDGVNWLCNNWWNIQHCILADEMGLGKTVQIATFVGTIVEKWNAYPVLVVVPNSTVSNWIREFERWAPRVRAVPFYGENRARERIASYELKTFHVLVTTYETVTNPKDFMAVFKKRPRWEALIIDEGQRLKNDNSLLFKKLNELNTVHRIIMTGTPLNNNIRELFNLMNFLDPDQWSDLESLEKEHEELSEDLVKQLHERLRPYFLRRTKKEVLKLPPKNEVIVPVSMAPLQKQIYRGILSRNLDILKNLNASAKGSAVSKANMNNMLMQLRKCLQHPYLVSDDIEPRGLPERETHLKLIEASTKLRLLKLLLPQLKARGHRVLLFSQFVLALDIIEDFLVGEGIKYLRLDGNTKQHERQKGMDEFNKEGSDIFIYLLTTRAGGVGINLWTADTVIIFDPDFNPHQDLQAIARAHRFGQKKTVLVFKLMVKDSAEERIMQIGKKKLVLDHLIVQKMDDDETGGDDVQSFLMFGAQALFNEEGDQASRDINYSETDVQKLIEKTEVEGEEQHDDDKGAGAFSFGFKVWAADNTLEDVADDAAAAGPMADSWAETLARIEAEKAKAMIAEESGRRTRKRAVASTQRIPGLDDSPPPTPPRKGAENKKKGKRRRLSADGGDSDFAVGSEPPSESDSDGSEGYQDLHEFLANRRKAGIPSPPPLKIDGSPLCGLCGKHHGGTCFMTESSDNLVAYRRILMEHTSDEPYELRVEAIQAIEEALNQRGHLHKLANQPLHLLREPVPPPTAAPLKYPQKKKSRTDAPDMSELSIGPLDAGPLSHLRRSPSPSEPQSFDTSSQFRKVPNTSKPHTVPREESAARREENGFLKASRNEVKDDRQNGISAPPRPKTQKPASETAPSALVRTKGEKGRPVDNAPAVLSSFTTRVPPETTTDAQIFLAQARAKKAAGSSASASSAAPVPAAQTGFQERPAKQLADKCIMCGQANHSPKRCPIVALGAESISNEIARLERDVEPSATVRETVAALRSILRKLKKQELAKRSEVIVIEDSA